MHEVAEWRFGLRGAMQVFQDARRAGLSSITLVEDKIERREADLRAKDITIKSSSNSDYVSTVIIDDPDGNQVVFAQARTSTNKSAS